MVQHFVVFGVASTAPTNATTSIIAACAVAEYCVAQKTDATIQFDAVTTVKRLMAGCCMR